MKFYETLENVLKSRNITVYKMCKDLKISTNTIGNYKNGTIPKIDIVQKISLYLGVSTDELINGSEYTNPILNAYYAASPEHRKQLENCWTFLKNRKRKNH